MDAAAEPHRAGKSSSSGSVLFIVLTVKEVTGSSRVSDHLIRILLSALAAQAPALRKVFRFHLEVCLLV